MASISIFISSPGDVGREREIARRVLGRLQGEFQGRAQLEPYFWEYEPMLASRDYQGNIPSTADFDIVVCILWSRLGSRLHSSYRRPEGGVYESGTEYELETARAAAASRADGTPDLLVYVNKSQPIIPPRPKDAREAATAQLDKLDAFIERWFRDHAEGVWRAASNSYRNLAQFEQNLEGHLRKLIERRLPKAAAEEPVHATPDWTKGSPFRGLQVFDFEHEKIFFGRTKAIDDVLTALRRQWVNRGSAFVLVLGASGSGKSSLVRAGVLPLMIQPGVMEGVGLWRRAVMRPSDAGSDLFAALAAALVQPDALPELLSSGKTAEQLAMQLREKPGAVEVRVEENLSHASDLQRVQARNDLERQAEGYDREGRMEDAAQVRTTAAQLKPPVARLALVIDQLEELFTLGVAAEQRDRFVVALRELVSGGHVAVLATLRSDFYSRYQESTELVALAEGDGRYDLARPTAQELGQMIRLPAQAAGLRFEEDAVTRQGLDEVLRDAAVKDAAVLPLIEFALDQLYEKRRGHILTYAAYGELGGVEGALARRAEEEFEKLSAQAKSAFDAVMRGVATTDADEEKTFVRHWALRDELTSAPGARALVEAFIAARLFQADQDESGRAIVSICHEALLEYWPRLKQWLEENHEFLRARARVSGAAAEWDQHARDADYLLTGKRLAEAEELLGRDELTGRDKVYVQASAREARDRARQALRRWQMVAALFAVVAVITIVVGWQAIEEKEAAQAAKDTAQQTLARSYFLQGEELKRRGKISTAMAYFARSLRIQPANNPSAVMAFSDLPTFAPLISALSAGGAVNTARFSPDGKWIVMASDNNRARTWDAQTGNWISEPLAHESAVNSASFSPDGKWVVTASSDDTARVWDAGTSKPVSPPLQHKSTVHTALFSPDGKWVVTASDDMTARVWDAQTGQPVSPPIEHKGNVYSACFSPDGTRVVTASQDGTARVWDAATGQPVTPPLPHGGPVYSACFSPDGKRVVTASDDATARVWDAQTGQPVTPPLRHQKTVNCADFSPDGNWVVTGSQDDTARVWDAQTGQPISPPLQNEGIVNATRFSPDGKWVITASDDGIAQMWDARTGAAIGSPLAHQGWVNDASFSPDGKWVVTASAVMSGGGMVYSSMGGAGHVWQAPGNLPTSRVLCEPGERAIYPFPGFQVASFSPDGKRIATLTGSDTVRVWDVQTSRPVSPPMKHKGAVVSIHFSPDGRWVLTASEDHTAQVWDAQSGQPISPPLQHEDALNSASFSPDGKWVVTASRDKTARVWNAQTGQPVSPPLQHHDTVWLASFSPDGRWVVTASQDKTAQVWDAQTGQPISPPLAQQDGVTCAHFSPDGKWVVTASQDKTARVWDARTGQPVSPPLEHQESVHSAIFSPDGRWVVTASDDKTGRVWDARTGKPISQPLTHSKPVWTAYFSPNGQEVVTAGGDVQVWDAQTAQPISAPIQQEDSIYYATFSPDGKSLVTVGNQVRIWDAAPETTAPPWLPDVLEALSLTSLDDSGALQRADVEKVKAARQERLASTSNDPWEIYGRWLFTDPQARTISPWSTVTLPEYVRSLLGDEEGQSTYEYGPMTEAESLVHNRPDLEALIAAKQASLPKPGTDP